MKKNNNALKLLKIFQEQQKNLVPIYFSAFALALNDMTDMSKDDIKEVMEIAQAILDSCCEKNINIIKWAEDEIDIDLHSFSMVKSRAGGNNNDR